MKKFSRSLVAIAATGALAVSGTSVASAATAGEVTAVLDLVDTAVDYGEVIAEYPDAKTWETVSPPFKASAESSAEDGLSSVVAENSSDENQLNFATSVADGMLSSVESDARNDWAFGTTYDIIVGVLIALGIGAALVGVAPQLGIELPQLPF